MQYFDHCGLMHHGIRNSNKYVAVSKRSIIQNSKLLSIMFCNAMIMIAGLGHLQNSSTRCHQHFINCMNSVFIVCESLILDGWCLMVCCSCEESQNKEAVAESCANAGRAALCRTLNDSPIPNKSGKHPQHLNGTHHYKKKRFLIHCMIKNLLLYQPQSHQIYKAKRGVEIHETKCATTTIRLETFVDNKS